MSRLSANAMEDDWQICSTMKGAIPMKLGIELKTEMETIPHQMVEAKKNKHADALNEVKRSCGGFDFTAGFLKNSLAKGRRKK